MRYPDLFVTLNLFCLAIGFAAGYLMAWGVRQWPKKVRPLSGAARRVLEGKR